MFIYPDFITDTPQARGLELIRLQSYIKAEEDAAKRRTPEAQRAETERNAIWDEINRPNRQRLRKTRVGNDEDAPF